jgi:hypothetical protein
MEWHVEPPADMQALIAALRREDAHAGAGSQITGHDSRRTR